MLRSGSKSETKIVEGDEEIGEPTEPSRSLGRCKGGAALSPSPVPHSAHFARRYLLFHLVFLLFLLTTEPGPRLLE